MCDYKGQRVSGGAKVNLYVRLSNEEGGDCFTRIIRQQDSIVHASSATDASGNVVPAACISSGFGILLRAF